MNKEDYFQRLIHKIQNAIQYTGLLITGIFLRPFKRKSSSIARGPQGKVELEYSLLEHSKTPNAFSLSFPDISEKNTLQISLEESFFHYVDIKKITPEPESIRKKGKNVVYTFHPQQTPFSIQFKTVSHHVGCFPLEIKVLNGPSIHFYKYVCP